MKISRFSNRLVTAAAIVLSASIAPVSSSADEITTIFASDNGGGGGGAVYFNLEVGASDLVITGVNTNAQDGSISLGDPPTGTFSGWLLYLLTGSSAFGMESNAAAWTLAGSGSVTTAARDTPSTVALDSGINLTANTLYGIAMVMPSEIGHAYTNGTASNLDYSNADLSLSFGSASNTPFGGVFSPRVWNGSLIYTKSAAQAVPEPGILTLLGIGLLCIGVTRRRRIG